MTPEHFKAARERCEKATPGPWVGWSMSARGAADGPPCGEVIGPQRVSVDHSIMFAPEDAEFIGCSRVDLPAALDEIERLRAELEEERSSNASLKETMEQVLALMKAMPGHEDKPVGPLPRPAFVCSLCHMLITTDTYHDEHHGDWCSLCTAETVRKMREDRKS